MSTDAAAADDEEDASDPEPPFPVSLPEGLDPRWPAPRRAVLGTHDGILARLEYAAARLFLGTLSRLPLALRGAVVGVLARGARAFDRRRSDAARTFLRQALGESMPSMDAREVEERVLQTWRHLFDITLDIEAIHRRYVGRAILERFDVEMCEDARKVRDSKSGSILVTLHVGDWEVGSAAMPWLGFDPFYGVAKPPKNRPLSVHMHRLREMRGVRLLPRRGAMKDAAAIVNAGGMLAMLLDQRARKRPVIAPFFGRPAKCDRSAAVLLKRLQVPIVFAACYREKAPWRWRLVIPTVLWPADLAKRSVEEITGLVNRELEKLILAAPDQYFWLHDRYRGT